MGDPEGSVSTSEKLRMIRVKKKEWLELKLRLKENINPEMKKKENRKHKPKMRKKNRKHKP